MWLVAIPWGSTAPEKELYKKPKLKKEKEKRNQS